MFFSPSKLNVSYFVLFGLQQLSVICLLQTKKKKEEWLSIIAAYPQTQYSYMFV